MDVTVRRAAAADLDEIARIEQLSFKTPWSRELLREELFFPLSLNLVLLGDGGIRGYVFSWLIPPEVHILDLAVDPVMRRRGLGRRIMEELFAEAAKHGGTKLTLEVRSGNSDAITFYQRFGFVMKGLRKGYYQDTGEDALILWREGGER